TASPRHVNCRSRGADRRAFVVPFLLGELLGAVDDDVALVVDGDAEAIERRLGRALGDGALGRVLAAVTGADDLAFARLGGAVLVGAGGADGVDFSVVVDDQNAVALGELVDDAGFGVIGLGPDVDGCFLEGGGGGGSAGPATGSWAARAATGGRGRRRFLGGVGDAAGRATRTR